MTVDELIAFEKEVAAAFEAGHIGCPVHLSGGNEEQLIEVFKNIDRRDWVFSTWRSHYHALLHGIPRERVMDEIMAGRSMNLASPDHHFFTSAIVGGCLPIAVGVAAAFKRRGAEQKVFCFVGDMCATTGAFHEACSYSRLQDLPITFVVEDNGFSADTPTRECWGDATPITLLQSRPYEAGEQIRRYAYERTYPHYGVAKAGGM